ncbi:MAG: NAD(P)-dependent oxidoreductase, partial [Nocardiopsaceae bacterium]|nr:NAD(P)-dependent oxidoreductase [Nocardiopsaceae bacterium]
MILRDQPVGRYPIELELAGRRTVVVGGGAVALRRAKALVESGAKVTVVAPDVSPELDTLPVTVCRRRYRT